MIHVFLDDYRRCPEGFTLVKTADECKLLIDEADIGILSLDYDLGWGNPTGYEVALHVVNTGRFPKEIYLHTSSAAGRDQMYELLSAHLPQGTKLNGGPMPQSVLDEARRGMQPG